jgi:hypothetical protein
MALQTLSPEGSRVRVNVGGPCSVLSFLPLGEQQLHGQPVMKRIERFSTSLVNSVS